MKNGRKSSGPPKVDAADLNYSHQKTTNKFGLRIINQLENDEI